MRGFSDRLALTVATAGCASVLLAPATGRAAPSDAGALEQASDTEAGTPKTVEAEAHAARGKAEPPTARPSQATEPAAAAESSEAGTALGGPEPNANSETEAAEQSASGFSPLIAGSVNLEAYTLTFDSRSRLNPNDVLNSTNGYQRFGTKLRSSFCLGNFSAVADGYFQMRSEFYPASSPRIIAAGYIYQLNAGWFPTDSLSLKLGKHVGVLGTSLSELVLLPYRTYADRRPNEGVNVVDDEGYWGAVLGLTFGRVSLHLDYLPAYAPNGPSELTNVNRQQAAQATLSTTFLGIDIKAQIYDELNAFKPFVAVSSSYAPPALPKLMLSLDLALVNHKDLLRVSTNADGTPNLVVTPLALRFLSPLLAGVSYSLTDWAQLKLEYLRDSYSLSSAERRTLFQSLSAHPETLYEVVAVTRRNLFSRHYAIVSWLMPGLWRKFDLFLGYKQSLTDGSAQGVGSATVQINQDVRISVEGFQMLYGNRWSEARNAFFVSQLGLKLAWFY